MKYCYLLLLLGCSLSCAAQKFTYNQGGTSAKNYYEELPYQNINGKLFIKVAVAGKSRLFLFDTGAPTTISKEIAAELKAPIIQKSRLGDVNGNADSVTTVDVNDIKLGSTVFNHIPAITLFPDFYKCWNAEGVIGSNILRNSIVLIDAGRHLIVLTDQTDKLNLNSAHSSPLKTNTDIQSTPMINIELKKKPNMMVEFDTGDANLLRMADGLLVQLNKSGVYEVVSKGFGASSYGVFGLQKNTDKSLVKFLSLGISGTKLSNVITQSSKSEIPGVGTRLLD